MQVKSQDLLLYEYLQKFRLFYNLNSKNQKKLVNFTIFLNNLKKLILKGINSAIEVYIEGFALNFVLYYVFGLAFNLKTLNGHLRIFAFGLLIYFVIKFIELIYKNKKSVALSGIDLNKRADLVGGSW